MKQLVGRDSEIKHLQEAIDHDQSELIAIYGRRRVGKTFLVREFYKKNMVFELTGLYQGLMRDQLRNFTTELNTRENRKHKIPKNWFEAFETLKTFLDTKRNAKKKVIFIDEFPWLATPKSKFKMAFENFWNTYCTKRTDLIVVICGSAASYMVQNIVYSKGGLHNRITRKIRLLPFTLYETEQFLKHKGLKYTRYDIVKLYMAIGGVPHYLDKLQKGLSVAQNIDYLCFEKDGILYEEFKHLYTSLFEHSEKHLKIIKALSESHKGMSRSELLEKVQMSSGGDFSLKMTELIESGFVSEYNYYKTEKQLSLYRLSDEYSRFYLKYIEKNKKSGTGTWMRIQQKQTYKSWSGYSFETLCLKHIRQIKKGLGIEGVFSNSSSWHNDTTQIDLLIDRDDQIINMCELKFYDSPFSIDKAYYLKIKQNIDAFKVATKTRKAIFPTIVSPFGLNENQYSKEIIQNWLDISCLFEK